MADGGAWWSTVAAASASADSTPSAEPLTSGLKGDPLYVASTDTRICIAGSDPSVSLLATFHEQPVRVSVRNRDTGEDIGSYTAKFTSKESFRGLVGLHSDIVVAASSRCRLHFIDVRSPGGSDRGCVHVCADVEALSAAACAATGVGCVDDVDAPGTHTSGAAARPTFVCGPEEWLPPELSECVWVSVGARTSGNAQTGGADYSRIAVVVALEPRTSRTGTKVSRSSNSALVLHVHLLRVSRHTHTHAHASSEAPPIKYVHESTLVAYVSYPSGGHLPRVRPLEDGRWLLESGDGWAVARVDTDTAPRSHDTSTTVFKLNIMQALTPVRLPADIAFFDSMADAVVNNSESGDEARLPTTGYRPCPLALPGGRVVIARDKNLDVFTFNPVTSMHEKVGGDFAAGEALSAGVERPIHRFAHMRQGLVLFQSGSYYRIVDVDSRSILVEREMQCKGAVHDIHVGCGADGRWHLLVRTDVSRGAGHPAADFVLQRDVMRSVVVPGAGAEAAAAILRATAPALTTRTSSNSTDAGRRAATPAAAPVSMPLNSTPSLQSGLSSTSVHSAGSEHRGDARLQSDAPPVAARPPPTSTAVPPAPFAPAATSTANAGKAASIPTSSGMLGDMRAAPSRRSSLPRAASPARLGGGDVESHEARVVRSHSEGREEATTLRERVEQLTAENRRLAAENERSHPFVAKYAECLESKHELEVRLASVNAENERLGKQVSDLTKTCQHLEAEKAAAAQRLQSDRDEALRRVEAERDQLRQRLSTMERSGRQRYPGFRLNFPHTDLDVPGDEYRIAHECGRRGAFSTVLFAQWKSQSLPVAVKELHNSGSNATATDDWMREGLIMNAIRSLRDFDPRAENLLTVFGIGMKEDRQEHRTGPPVKRLFVVMEKMKCSLTAAVASTMPVPSVVRAVWHAARGLAAMHAASLVHADIKADNVLLTDTVPFVAKIADFGLARISRGSDATSCGDAHGTYAFLSPELVADGSHKNTVRSDVYAFAMLVYEVLTGCKPFHSRDGKPDFPSTALLLDAVKHGQRPNLSLLRSDAPEALKEIMEACWAGDADTRPTMDAVVGKIERVYRELDPDGYACDMSGKPLPVASTAATSPSTSAAASGPSLEYAMVQRVPAPSPAPAPRPSAVPLTPIAGQSGSAVAMPQPSPSAARTAQHSASDSGSAALSGSVHAPPVGFTGALPPGMQVMHPGMPMAMHGGAQPGPHMMYGPQFMGAGAPPGYAQPFGPYPGMMAAYPYPGGSYVMHAMPGGAMHGVPMPGAAMHGGQVMHPSFDGHAARGTPQMQSMMMTTGTDALGYASYGSATPVPPSPMPAQLPASGSTSSRLDEYYQAPPSS